MNSILKGAELGFDLGYAEIIYHHNNEDGSTFPSDPHDEKGKHVGILRLKDPDGLLYSNFIISSIFAELEGTII